MAEKMTRCGRRGADEPATSVAGEVTRLRTDAGLTQSELAELSGVAQSNISAYENGTRRPSAKMVARLRRSAKPRPAVVLAVHRDEVIRIARHHGAGTVRVFGSVARGEDRPGSDVDLLVTFSLGASLFDQAELTSDLEALLGVRVDVVSEGGLRGAHDAIRAEARSL